MSGSLGVLMGTAATIGLLHTLLGPDHYVPFIVLAKARSWSMRRAAVVTLLCGLGHVVSSVVLGAVGLAIGAAVFSLEAIESFRGEIAGWLLFGFGFAYLLYGVQAAIRNRPHTHSHAHRDGHSHEHEHSHVAEHTHPHESSSKQKTVWVLFIIFVFGPCEPLIPLLMYPAAEGGWQNAMAVAAVFAVTTIGTMIAMVLVGAYGLSLVPMNRIARYGHAAAGVAITTSGALILFAGL